MAPFSNDDGHDDGNQVDNHDRARARGRRAARYAVPVAVVGVAAATIGLVPALADSGDPDLPSLTPQELVAKIAASDTEELSGTVKISTDLGLPDLGDLGGLGGGLAPGSGRGSADGSTGSSADPSAKLIELAAGTHTLRVAADGPDRQKVSVLENAAEYSLIRNADEIWAYDSGSDEAYHRTLPKDAPEHGGQRRGKDSDQGREQGDDRTGRLPATPKEFAEEALKAADPTTSVTVDGTARVAGRDAYNLVLKPKASAGSTVGAVTVAVDAKTGTPLKFTLTPASGGAAVIDAGFTEVDFSAPDASTFDFKPPKGTKVTEDDGTDGARDSHGKHGPLGTQHSGSDRDRDRTDGSRTPRQGKDDASGAVRGGGMETIGEGWTAIAHIDSGENGRMPGGNGRMPGVKEGEMPQGMGAAGMGGLLSSLGERVKGDFGSGTLVKTRLVNALITDDGQVYAGAVTKDALLKAAGSAK